MSVITEKSVVVIGENLSVADLGGEMVLLDVSAGKYYGLNELGAIILELIPQPILVSEVIEVILQQYDVTREQLSPDVIRFLEDLEGNRLIRIVTETTA